MNASLRRKLVSTVVAALIGAIVFAWLLWVAPQTDYQATFFRMVATVAVTALFITIQLQRAAAQSGRRWWVPIGIGVVLLTSVALLRFESFSGEMVPRLAWRWSSRTVPELQRKSDAEKPSPPSSTEPTRDLDPSLQNMWPQFLGPDRNGIIEQRGFEIPTGPADVRKLWDIGIGGGWSSFAVAIDAGGQAIAVTLEQRQERECVTAYRLSDGELVWLVDHEALHSNPLGGDGPRSTPTIAGDRVFAAGATGTVWCLDLTTGETIWRVDLLKLGGWTQTEAEAVTPWGRSASPLLIDDLCVLPLGSPASAQATDDRSLVALDQSTGEVRWRAGEDQISYASPQPMTIGTSRQIVSVNETTITGHEIATGKTLWSVDWFGQSAGGPSCASVIPCGEDRFLIGKGYGGGGALLQISQTDGGDWSAEAVWKSARVLKTKFNHAVVRDGIAYALSNGALQAVQIESGKELWQQPRRERSGQGQPILAGDTLIVQNETGEVIFVDADPTAYVARYELPALRDKTWNIPTLVGNILLVRNSEEAIAFELTPVIDSAVQPAP